MSMRRNISLQKYIQHLKQFTRVQIKNYFDSLEIPLPPDNQFCRKLYGSLVIYQKKDKDGLHDFKEILMEINYQKFIKKTKNPLCGGILKNGDKAYKCWDCLTQDNSIVCGKCFDLSKHIGHRFQRITVYGGCCDCGDIQKWKQQGFCQEHQIQQQPDILMDEQLQSKYILQQQYAFSIILHMYDKFLEIRQVIKKTQNILANLNLGFLNNLQSAAKMKEEAIKKIVGQIEKYNYAYFQQLIQFNKAGQYAHYMTYSLFQSIVTDKYKYLESMKDKPTVFNILFTFKELHETPGSICDIFISMLSYKTFKEQLVVFFIKRYNSDPEFSWSGYNHLSSQLLTSHITMSKVIKKGLIQPLRYNPVLQEQEKGLERMAESFVRFFIDINYLSKLYGEAAIEYFQFIAKKQQISNLGYYRKLFNNSPQSIQYYGLQNIFISKMDNIAKLISHDESNIIYRHALKDLFKFMTSFKTQKSCYYRPQERLFTMIIFSKLNCQLSSLDNDQFIKDLISIFEPKDLQSQISMLLENAFNLVSFIAQQMQNANHQIFYTFNSYYLKKKNVIFFSLDSIFIRILIKIADYHNKNVMNQDQIINYEKIILKSSVSLHKIINFYDNQKQLMTTLNNISMKPEFLGYSINYYQLVYEIFSSDVHELKLACYYKNNELCSKQFSFEAVFKERILHYYQNILKSYKNQRILIKDFKEQCQCFFNEENIFKEFIKLHVDKSDPKKLLPHNNEHNQMNANYFISISHQFNNISFKGPLKIIPYQKINKLPAIFDRNINIFEKALQYMIFLSQDSEEQQNNERIQLIIRNSYKKYISFALLVYSQTVSSQNKQRLQHYFTLTLDQNTKELKKHIVQNQNLIKEIKGELKNDKNGQQKMQIQGENQIEEAKLKEKQKKLKLQMKKKAIQNKINKNKEVFLLQNNVQNQGEICYFCKENNSNQILYYNAFITLTNFNLWFGLGQNKFPFFNTCGHMVHQKCYVNSLSKNQIFNYCILCKKSVNILIPSNLVQNHTNQKIQQDFWKSYKDIRTIFQDNYDQKEEMRNFTASLIIMIVLKGINPESHNRSFILYRLIIPFIKAYYHINPSNEISFIASIKYTQDNQKIKQIFQFVEDQLMKSLFKAENKQQKPQDYSLTKQVKVNIQKCIQLLMTQNGDNFNQYEKSSEKQLLVSMIHKPIFQNNLRELTSKYLKKCDNCEIITQVQAICLICKHYSTCIGCSKEGLIAHSALNHLGICSFLSTNTGQVIYIYQQRFWKFESIYEDYAGRSYKQQKMQNNKGQFVLSKAKLNEYLQDITNFNIQNRLRYKQKIDNKVNHSVVL